MLLELPGVEPVAALPAAPRLRVHLSDGDEQRLVDRYHQGATLRGSAVEFGVNREKVSQILDRHGVPRRYHQTVTVDLDRAAELEAEGLSLTEIASRLGVGRTTLVRARRESRSSSASFG